MITKATPVFWRLMNISTDCVTRLLFQMFFAVRLHVLLADFLLFVSRPTDTPHRTMICNSFSFTFCTRCYFVSCLFVSIKILKRPVDTSDGDCTEYGTVILCRAHSAAKRKKAVSEDWQFCCYSMLKAGSIPRCTYLY